MPLSARAADFPIPRFTSRVRAPHMAAQAYDKAAKYPSGHGYEPRVAAPTSIVVHSTSSSTKNTPFASEAQFLYAAPLVGAHYLIGKDGAVVRFFDPLKWAAWHAGKARSEFSNQRSIGVELHHSVGDDFYPAAQLDALAALLSQLSTACSIPFGMVETHGQIALPGPYKRKTDPSGWLHSDFIRWRDELVQGVPASPPKRYRVRAGLPVYQRPERVGPLWGFLVPDEEVVIDDPVTGHDALGRGFVDMNGLVLK